MCFKASRYRCFRCFLLHLTLLIFLVSAGLVGVFIGTYYVTEEATIVKSNETTAETTAPVAAAAAAAAALVDQPTEVADNRSLADWIVEDHLTSKCVAVQLLVDYGHLFHACSDGDKNKPEGQVTSLPIDHEKIPRREYVQCSRKIILYSGYGAAGLTALTFLSLVSLCALCQCPLLSLAFAYVLLATGLLTIMLYYESSVILHQGGPILISMVALISLLSLLGFLYILLFTLVACEQKHARRLDVDKAGKRAADDEDDIDDPKRPLYENGYSPTNKNDFEERIKGFKYIDDDMSYILRKA